MRQLKFILRNLWDLIRLGRFKTNREKLLDIAKKDGYTSIEVMPKKKSRIKKKFRKAPRINN